MRPGLGRRVEHDPQSKLYPARRATQLRSVLWRHRAPILDQGQTNSCTGHALAQCLNTTRFSAARPLRHYLDHQDALDLYSAATRLDEFPGPTYPPADDGSSGLGVAKAGVQLGYLSRYDHAFGLDHLLAALQLQPVIVGTTWRDDMFEPNSRGYLKPTGADAGGHEYVVLGANLRWTYVTILNSWGRDWSRRGRAKISFGDLTTLLDDQGDVTVPIGRV